MDFTRSISKSIEDLFGLLAGDSVNQFVAAGSSCLEGSLQLGILSITFCSELLSESFLVLLELFHDFASLIFVHATFQSLSHHVSLLLDLLLADGIFFLYVRSNLLDFLIILILKFLLSIFALDGDGYVQVFHLRVTFGNGTVKLNCSSNLCHLLFFSLNWLQESGNLVDILLDKGSVLKGL